MDSPIASLYEPQAADESAAPAAAPVVEPGKIESPISSLYHPSTDRRSAEEVMYRGRSTGKDWADTKKQLEAEGYRPTAETGTQYEQGRALQAEKVKQGQGVSFADQAVRNLIPWGSAVINSRRESAYADATKRYQDGKASQEDYETIAAHDRRAAADQKINSTTAGQLLNIPLQAPAIIGEAYGGGKLVGAAGKALGVGQATAQGTARTVMNFAGKQALTTPLMPSMYLQHANQTNIEAGRDPNDVRGFAPALGLAYANNLVLGSLQKYGGGGNLLQQAVKKGAIGVGEQAAADVVAGGIDEFLPDAYKMKTRYGALGDLARGDVSKGLGHATIQALTFSYFSALHGKSPDKITDAYKEAVDASAKAGLGPDAAAEKITSITDRLSDHLKQRVGQAATDTYARDQEFYQEDARNLFQNVDALTKGMTGEQQATVKKYVDALIDIFPKRGENKGKNRPPAEANKTDVRIEDDAARHGDEGPVPEPKEQVSETKPVDHVANLEPQERKDLARSLGYNEKGLTEAMKDPKKAKGIQGFAEHVNKLKQSTETAPRGERSHTANYKDPSRSVDKAIEMMEKRGSAPLPLETWQDPVNAKGQAAKGTASFVLDTNHYSGEIHGRQGIDNLRNSKYPLPYDPALKKVVYKGDASEPGYAKLHEAVQEMNKRRSDEALMRSVGHTGKLPPVRIEVSGEGPVPTNRLQRVDRRHTPTEGHPARREGEANHGKPHPEVVKSAHEIGGDEGVKAVTELHEELNNGTGDLAEATKAAAEAVKEVENVRREASGDPERGVDRPGEPAVTGEPVGDRGGKLAAEAESSGIRSADVDADRTRDQAAAKPRKPRQAKGKDVKASSGIDLLKSASKKTGVAWMEGHQDPIAQEILSGPDADKIAAEIPPGSKYLSSGVSSIAFRTPKGDVIRIEPRAPESPTKISSPDIIKPLKSKRIGGTEITHVPFADTKTTTEADVAELKSRLEKQGIDWHDAGTDNAGRLANGRLVVIDRGSVRKAPKPAKKPKAEPKPVKPAKGKPVDAVERVKAANAAYAEFNARTKPIFDRYENLKDPAQRQAFQKELDRLDVESNRLTTERKDALESLADQNGSEFAVHVVDGPGAEPREVERHTSLERANQASRRIANKETRGQVERSAGKDIKNELGEKLHADGHPNSAQRHYGPNGKQVYVSRVDRAPKPAPESARKLPKKRPRIDTVADAVRDAGGIKFDSAMESHFKSQDDAVKNGGLNVNLFSKKGRSIDQLAQELHRHTGTKDPQDLINALMDNRPSRLADRASADEHDLKEHWRKQEEEAKAKGDTEKFDPNAEIPFSRGPRPGGAAEPSETKGGGGPFQIIAEQNKLFGNRNYVEKSVPGAPGDVSAAARLAERATVTGKKSAGDAEVNLEEHAHHIQKQYGLTTDPAGLPLVVAKGIQQFFAPRAKSYGVSPTVPSRTGMIEGFADWLIARSKGGLTGLSPAQEVASKYLEKWAADNKLTEKFDRLKELYADYAGQTPEVKAAGLVSATGKPAEVPKTTKEAAQDLANKAQEAIDDSLAVLNRNGAPKGLAKRVKAIWSQLMYADPHRAAEFERDGVHTYEGGRKKVIGLPFEKIVEGAKPEWLKPGENGGASRAGVYAVAKHVLGEEARGRKNLVSPEQLEAYRSAFEEFKKDEPFRLWAEEFSDRLTKAFNDTRRSLAGKDVHFLSPEEVAEWEKKFPDYIPTDRVMQDQGWKASGGARGESPRKVTGERSGSGEQIVDPLISYKNRLRVTSAVMGEQLKRIELEKLVKAAGGKWGLSSGSEKLTDLGELRAETLEKLGFTGDNLRNILKDMGLSRAEEYFTQRPWPTDGTKPTWGLKGADGKLVNYRIGDRDLYNLATGQQVDANATASWLRATANFLPIRLMTQAVKFGATSASLGFQFRNVPRDIYTFWANTIDRAKANPRDLGDAYKRAFAYSWHQLTDHFSGAPSQDALYKRFAADRGLDQRQFTFEKDNPASAYAPSETKWIKEAHTVWGILKDVLNLAGAGENAPRFLEWKTRLEQTTGKSSAELTKELEAAEAAQKAGKPIADPIPFHQAMDAMEHAAEVTVNFNRLGTVTREVNKITPFFGPAIAGLSKSVRNWKENPKGAAFAMSGLLAARLLHWAMFSDEDWYKELNSNDRYNNFVVPTPAGLRRLPAPRDLEVAGGGLLIASLDAAAGKNPDFKGLLRESLGAVAPPAPVPPAAKTGYEIARNENWMGSPIVPKRDENKSVQDKWTDDRLPYAADQLTGGLLSARKIPSEAKDLIPYSEVKNARRSVDEFYERFHDMEEQRNKALKQGKRFEKQAEYHRLNAAQEQIVTLGRAVRGDRMVNGRVVKGEPPTPEKAQELRAKQIQVARKALGTE